MSLDWVAKASRGLAAIDAERTYEQRHGNSAEGEEAPLVTCFSESRAEIGNDPDPGECNIVDDCRPGNTRDKADGHEHGSPASEPIIFRQSESLRCY